MVCNRKGGYTATFRIPVNQHDRSGEHHGESIARPYLGCQHARLRVPPIGRPTTEFDETGPDGAGACGLSARSAAGSRAATRAWDRALYDRREFAAGALSRPPSRRWLDHPGQIRCNLVPRHGLFCGDGAGQLDKEGFVGSKPGCQFAHMLGLQRVQHHSIVS